MTAQIGTAPLPERTAFHHSWTKAGLVVLVMVAVMTGWSLEPPQLDLPVDAHIAARIVIVLCVVGAANFLWLEFSVKPVLIVDATGVLIPKLGSALIPWSEVLAVHRQRFPRTSLIWFELRDPQRFVPPAPTVRGFFLRLKRRFRDPLISIETYLVKENIDEALATIERYRAQDLEASSSRR